MTRVSVVLAEDPFDPQSWTRHVVEDVCGFLAERFGEHFPPSARIYHEAVADDHDVTPADEAGIARLASLDGTLYVVVYPAGPVAIVVAIVAVVAVAAAVFLLRPQVPTVATRNLESVSPNNALSDRVNQARVNGRIPDIFGQVTSTPDLLAVPYKVFDDNQEEIEVAYMCIGRGVYDVDKVQDDTTLVAEIEGSSVEVYGPYSSPNTTDGPQQRIGLEIPYPLVAAKRINAVNGQLLSPPGGGSSFKVPCAYKYPNQINSATTVDVLKIGPGGETFDDFEPVDLTQYFSVGQNLVVDMLPTSETGHAAVDLSGTYTISAVTATQILLASPHDSNTDWDVLSGYPGNTTDQVPTTLSVAGTDWVGPFTLDVSDLDRVYANFVALNGLYEDDGTNQFQINVTVGLELTPVDENGDPTGPAENFFADVVGSATERTTRAVTIMAEPTFTGRCKVRGHRLSDTDSTFAGTVVDEVKWRDLYAISPVTQADFGNVTTVYAVTRGTEGALAVKQRKLNMLVTRRLRPRISGSTFSTDLVATTSAADILSAVCLDPYIGDRDPSEVDFDSIYDTLDAVETYFGTPEAAQFCYTFDKENLSFEETVAAIAQAAFCIAYRRGSQIKLLFERETEDSTLLFNHRNKTPGSETRTVTFGTIDDVDGVAYEYASPIDDALVTLYVPQGEATALNPRKVESIGVRSDVQAYLQAWRAWNKIRYQNVAVEFEASQEADLLVVSDRILVADNTRSDTMDGEVVSQDVLQLTLSQAFEYTGSLDHTIFLQHVDGTIEGIDIASRDSVDHHNVVLAGAPSAALALDDDLYARTTYVIVGASDARTSAFLVTEKEATESFGWTVRAVNYDARYYQNDGDYLSTGGVAVGHP